MKLKTLLLGSAAAMIAVSGARAADAVIAEPEPVDYVKVCDMYGAGFFYIPGTETCLKINGYVDVQYEYTSRNNIAPGQLGLLAANYNTAPFGRASIGEPVFLARVNFDAREETDWGTLQSYIRMEAGGSNAAANPSVNALDVYISLGGFSAGRRTVATETGGLPGLMLDGYYGGGRHWYADYTYAANGFSATAGASLDDGTALRFAATGFLNITTSGAPTTAVAITAPLSGLFANALNQAGAAKSLDPYVVASYTGSMWTIRGKYHYDTSAAESWYGIDGSVTPIDGLTIRGWYEKATGLTEYAATESLCGNLGINILNTTNVFNGGAAGCAGGTMYSDNTWGVGASWAVMDNVSVAIGYSQMQLLSGYQTMINAALNNPAFIGVNPGAFLRIDDVQGFTAGVDWNPVDNLVVRMNYRRQEWGPSTTDEFRVRLRRSF